MLPKFAKIIFTYGSFANPFLNITLDSNIDETWQLLFIAMKYEWKRNHFLALKKVERGLEKIEKRNTEKQIFLPKISEYTKGRTIFYLLSAQKLIILEKMGDRVKARNLYEKLRGEYFKMPTFARQIVTPILLNYYSIEDATISSRPRSWSKDYEKDPISRTAMFLGKARNEIEKNKNLHSAVSFLIRTYKVASKIPQPMIVIESLNEIAWYIKASHPKLALRISEKASYLSGWYKEDVEDIFYVLDTLFECQKTTRAEEVLGTVEILFNNAQHLFSNKGWGTKSDFNALLASCKKLKVNFKKSLYMNTRTIRNYLKKYMTTITAASSKSKISQDGISDIFNYKSKNVRGYTLRKLINGLNIGFDLCAPYPFINEFYKLKIEIEFSKSSELLKKLTFEEVMILLVSTYMAQTERRKSLAYLSRKGILEKIVTIVKDIDEFLFFMSKRYETKRFVNQMVGNIHPFLKARQELAQSYLEKMSVSNRQKFISFYVKENEEGRQIIDKFVRNYIRYDINWEAHVDVPKEIKRYVEFFHLKKLPASLAVWAFEKKRDRTVILSLCQDLHAQSNEMERP